MLPSCQEIILLILLELLPFLYFEQEHCAYPLQTVCPNPVLHTFSPPLVSLIVPTSLVSVYLFILLELLPFLLIT